MTPVCTMADASVSFIDGLDEFKPTPEFDQRDLVELICRWNRCVAGTDVPLGKSRSVCPAGRTMCSCLHFHKI